ncbi:DNA ligase D [Cupriavidus basilensis]|uniref:DNA ligase (ATP) n=1 Tax=Cupriavidus basilensis TaxID=68895 RepID=A0A643G009_9BURK|nr:DNA ligase D [Cupriavidus basilensis]QOT82148.1 DNA ligase D [Cupriavidus basilensis]
MAKSASSNARTLERYRQKRDFAATTEPIGQVSAAGAASGALGFVVQKHAARRLHYDFRLELEGTLKSWAVPKGPSLDPTEKRMAVHVEDHPLDYASFEGVIPPKEYGAGTVIVWDRGTWMPVGDPVAGYQSGKLKFELQGEKLHGHWTLVRMRGRGDERQDPWLLIKERDAFARSAAEYDVTEALPDSVLAQGNSKSAAGGNAKTAVPKQRRSRPGQGRQVLPAAARPAPLPLALAPQLATLTSTVPRNAKQWAYEIKFDGIRLLARIDGDDVRLFTRNGHDWTSRLKSLAAEIRALGLGSAWLDGEIVILSANGTTDFQALQNAFDSSKVEDILYFVFDFPFFQGHDLRLVPLAERRALLKAVIAVPAATRVRYSEAFEGTPDDLLAAACQMGLEGLIGKRVDAPYVSARAPSWIKLKCKQRQEFVICGFTAPKGSRQGLGALLLGLHDETGKLHYAGSVGSGLDSRMLTKLLAMLTELEVPVCPLGKLPPRVVARWVKPKLVAEISFAEWTKEGRIRHPVFHALRADKAAGNVTRERPVDVEQLRPRPARSVKVSNADRVIDPTTGLTKGDLVGFYEAIAPHLLPHLRGRPVSLVRGPTGIDGELFFQKHAETIKIPGINVLDASLWAGYPPLLEIASQTAIVAAAQLNVIEFHTWNATKRAIDKPDRVIFDLDPGDGVPWRHMLDAAMLTKTMLDELGLVSFLKTSGGKGLHVVVPIAPKLQWSTVKTFSQDVVLHIAQTIPQRFVSKSGSRNRVGKVYIDYLRNGQGATTVSAFSARARPGLGVSVPVSWQELEELTAGDHWTIRTALQRVDAAGYVDPWAEYADTRKVQQIGTAIRKLAG